jgi:hypothetical protein
MAWPRKRFLVLATVLESRSRTCDCLVMVDEDPTGLHLEVYDTKSGLWHPELGDLDQPDGWDVLPAGDAFVTRQVKAAGDYWVLFRPEGSRAASPPVGSGCPDRSDHRSTSSGGCHRLATRDKARVQWSSTRAS